MWNDVPWKLPREENPHNTGGPHVCRIFSVCVYTCVFRGNTEGNEGEGNANSVEWFLLTAEDRFKR